MIANAWQILVVALAGWLIRAVRSGGSSESLGKKRPEGSSSGGFKVHSGRYSSTAEF